MRVGSRVVRTIAAGAVSTLLLMAGPLVGSASAAPAITNFSPLAGTINGPTVLTVNGSGFLPGAQVTLEHPAPFPQTGSLVLHSTGATTNAGGTQITNARFDTVGQPPQFYKVVVTNPDATAASSGDGSTTGFQLTADGPAVVSANPSDGAQGATVSVQIGGANFARGATITFPDTDANPLNNIMVTTATWAGLQSYQLTISIPAAAPIGPRDITLMNTDGQSGTCVKCFTVKAAIIPPTPPTVKTVTPPNSNNDSNKGAVAVTVTGTNFHGTGSGAPISVQLRGACPDSNPCGLTGRSLTGTAPSVTQGATALDDDTVAANFDFRLAAPGQYDVVVINTDDGGTGTKAKGFLVVATGAPVITSPTSGAPANVAAGTTQTITIGGDFFSNGDRVVISNSTGVAISNTNVLSRTQIRFTATVSNGAAAGAHDLSVVHTDTQSGTCGSCVSISGASGLGRPTWFLTNSPPPPGAAEIAFTYGASTDFPLSCDWDGDGTATPGIFRNGLWFLRNSNTTGVADVTLSFGSPGDYPICGKWNGTGAATVGIVRNGVWYLRNSNTSGNADTVFSFGASSDFPLVGDWNGDGTFTPGVFRTGQVFLRNSNTTGAADSSFGYGASTDFPMAGDWNGDGTYTIGIDRNGVFFLRNAVGGGPADVPAFAFGNPNGDFPIAADYDGTKTTTIGVVRL